MNHKQERSEALSTDLTLQGLDPLILLRWLWQSDVTLIHFVHTAHQLGFVVTSFWDPTTGMPTLVRYH